jgi:hypothetical protein
MAPLVLVGAFRFLPSCSGTIRYFRPVLDVLTALRSRRLRSVERRQPYPTVR